MFAEITPEPRYTVAFLGVIALVVVIVLAVLAIGMFQARSLIRRELAAYFFSPIAYVVLVVFLVVTGHLFALTFNLLTTTGPKGTEWPMQSMFADERFWLVFLFIPPLLTMRLFAEERSLRHAGSAHDRAAARLAGRAGQVLRLPGVLRPSLAAHARLSARAARRGEAHLSAESGCLAWRGRRGALPW